MSVYVGILHCFSFILYHLNLSDKTCQYINLYKVPNIADVSYCEIISHVINEFGEKLTEKRLV
jgi:hypothetical protein